MNTPRTPDNILSMMARTFRERNAVYGDNFRNVGPALQALFPNGVVLNTAADHETFHLLSLIVVKLSRFANAGLMHRDSIHDVSVYGAMLESIIEERECAAADEILSTAMTNDVLHEAAEGMKRAVENYSDEPIADTEDPLAGESALDFYRRKQAERAELESTDDLGVDPEHPDSIARREALEAQQSRVSVHDDAHTDLPPSASMRIDEGPELR